MWLLLGITLAIIGGGVGLWASRRFGFARTPLPYILGGFSAVSIALDLMKLPQDSLRFKFFLWLMVAVVCSLIAQNYYLRREAKR
jgi:hypothetical protein